MTAGSLSAQTIINFDGFDAGTINGQNGWSVTNTETDVNIAAGGLTYAGGDVSHPRDDGAPFKLQVLGGEESRASVALPSAITAETTFYISFLVNQVSDDHFFWLGLGGGAADQASSISFVQQANNYRTRIVDANNDTNQQSGGGAGLITGQTRLVVGEVFFGGTTANSTITMWLDPTSLVKSENTPIHTDNGRNIGTDTLTTLWTRKGSNDGETHIDHIMIGDSWEAVVVPEPSTYAALLGLIALGVVAWRRRRR